MTENEAKQKLDSLHYKIVHTSFCNKVYESEIEALCMAIKALEELKELKNGGIPIIHGKAELELHDKKIRNKAIDEFAEKMKAYLDKKYSFGGIDGRFKFFEGIDEIAEQMKDGEIVKDLSEEHNNKLLIDGEYCWQTCGSTEHCKECRRLSNGDIDYYENYDCLVEEPQDTWKQQTMSRFERVE